MAGRKQRLVEPTLVHSLARLSTGVLLRAYDDTRLAKLQDDLSRDLGRLEGRFEEISAANREFALYGTIKVLGWATAVLSFGLGFADILLADEVAMLAGLSLGFGAGGLGIGLLIDRRECRRKRARNRELEELRQHLRDLTIALARIRAARFLRPSPPAQPENDVLDR